MGLFKKQDNDTWNTENIDPWNMSDARVSSEPGSVRGSRRGKGSFGKGVIVGVLLTTILCGVIFAVCEINGVYIGPSGSAESVVNTSTLYKLQLLEQEIDSEYYQADSVTREQKENGIYKGLVDSLGDPYSEYYTAEELQTISESVSGTYSGIGAYISLDQQTGYPKISGVIAGAPAEAAGLQANDIIYKVDDVDTTGMSLDEVVSHVRGEKGTDVVLTIVRSGETENLAITITRDDVSTPTVTSKMLDNNIGYLQIQEFDVITTSQFEEHLQTLYDAGMQALILDLRDNPGGEVNTVTAIANDLIPEGLVFYMEDKDGNRTEYTASGENEIQIPLAVLVNGNSASASEILTGAIQDSGCGTIIGTQTYGKGIVQSIYTLQDGTAIKLTIADYYTRGGNNIHKVGITPDIVVELDTEAYLADGTDNQLQTAIDTLQKEMGQ